MIRRDELKQSQAGIKIKGGAGKVSYETIQAAIAAKAEEYGIPVAFENDVIRSGGLFNKQEEPCLGDRGKFCVIDNPRQYENLRLSQE